MQIRRARQDDIAIIAKIEESAPSAWKASQIAQELAHENGISLVALREKTWVPVGWCCARILPPEAELLKITILPEHQKTGIGTLLLEFLVDSCLRCKCNSLFAEVRENNTSARKFYQKVGFQETGRRENYYRDPVDNCITLQLSL